MNFISAEEIVDGHQRRGGEETRNYRMMDAGQRPEVSGE